MVSVASCKDAQPLADRWPTVCESWAQLHEIVARSAVSRCTVHLPHDGRRCPATRAQDVARWSRLCAMRWRTMALEDAALGAAACGHAPHAILAVAVVRKISGVVATAEFLLLGFEIFGPKIVFKPKLMQLNCKIRF
ncbi:hypothetical protein F511_44103 [Dorcoceras hygrometricum]|uniref:Uncharacterized protein n=1 Tax=Dorcoceras hygrometricum TaxID=472368 RepID=A0A2Z7BAZ7_9LAMI|nr:hypothetical protein F511_44103 [Dorcoceras hygrometricum]